VPQWLYDRGEIHNLTIERGTLTQEERYKINDHINQTIAMLAKLPLPRRLAQVPEIAAGHHERVDGRGYPRQLRGEEMSLLARMMAVADVFEVLTAADRPYKPAKKLSEALAIMQTMADSGHLDPEVFALFRRAAVWRPYALDYMPPAQVDLD
jgi:HD-GYP domain-containing protein (c-di-GMP phosphodiesterase class II)